MVKHIVMWRLKENALGATKQENAEKLRQLLTELKSKVPQIVDLEVGINFDESEAAYDVALYSTFKNREDLDIYQKDAEHAKIKAFVAQIRTERVMADYFAD